MGRGADCLILDDYLKSSDEARSQAVRDSHYEWWISTAMTRLNKGGVAVGIATRWHEDDLFGRLVCDRDAGHGEPWEVLNLPAIAEADDPLGRQPGEALWPSQFPIQVLEAIKAQQGPAWFSAMYMGRPMAMEGGIFKRSLFRTFTFNRENGMFVLQQPGGITKLVSENQGRRIITVDLATSERQTADYTVLACVFISSEGDMLVEDIVRQRIEGPELLPTIEAVFRSYQPAVVDIEAVGFQLAVVQMAVRAGLPVRKLEAKGDKVGRAMALAAIMQNGRVYFKAGAPWLHELELELCSFPHGAHDDQCDALSYAAMDMTRYGVQPWDAAYGVKRCPKCEAGYVGEECPRCSPQAVLVELRALSGGRQSAQLAEIASIAPQIGRG